MSDFDPVVFAKEHLPKLLAAVRTRQVQWTEMPPDQEKSVHGFQGICPDYTLVVVQGNSEEHGVSYEAAATWRKGFVNFHLPPELAPEIYSAATAAQN